MFILPETITITWSITVSALTSGMMKYTACPIDRCVRPTTATKTAAEKTIFPVTYICTRSGVYFFPVPVLCHDIRK
jgi:hypothetical protein